MDKHLLPVFGDRPINEITRGDVKDFLYGKQARKPKKTLAPATVRIIRAYLSAVLTEAVDDELITVNPAAKTGRFIGSGGSPKKAAPLSWEDRTILETTVKKHFPRYFPLFICENRTGLRFGELIALKPGDIDFTGRFIEVRRNCVRGKITTPKNGKTRRVDMSKQLEEVLSVHLLERKKEALKRGWGYPPEWLFYSEDGNFIDINNFRKRVFAKVFEKAKLRHVRIHDLRHTYATLRILAGQDITDVSKQLGHHSIKITIDTYYKWMPGTRKSQVDQLDATTAPNCTLYAPSHDETKEKRVNHNG